MEASIYTEILHQCRNIEQLVEWQDYLGVNGKPKKLITGYEVCDAYAKEQAEEKLVFQFFKNQLKYLLIYPNYKEYLAEPEHWEIPTLDGVLEKEAILMWAKEHTDFKIGETNEWGKATIDFDKYLGRAMIICTVD